MKGVSLYLNDDKTEIVAKIDPLLFEGEFALDVFEEYVQASDFKGFTLSKTNILQLSNAVTAASTNNDNELIEQVIGEISPAKIEIEIAKDKMSATLSVQSPHFGALPSLDSILDEIKQSGITFGISKKRIKQLIEMANDAPPGSDFSEVIAKGLPAKNGKNSFITPIVENVLDRVLAPKKIAGDKVDMRNLGDTLCVDQNTPIAKRIAPSTGRAGKTITGAIIEPVAGKLEDIKLGVNTEISTDDKDLIVAAVSGQPKFRKGQMFIDETYTSKGVNVGTGNIDYAGAVIVNGDVTEHMEIRAKGDITINGFVESAYIRSDGDIIITHGATGKMNEQDCQIIAGGSVFIQHAQGLDIICGANLVVAKQLAYSRVKCKGGVTIGEIDKPMGNLFACTINCYSNLRAGTIGAVSGSALSVDFSEGYKFLCAHIEGITQLLKQLLSNNVDHEIKLATFKSKFIPQSLQLKLANLTDEVAKERLLGAWLKASLAELQSRKQAYEINARVIANKELFPGVNVVLNNKAWHAEREYMACRVILEQDNWLLESLA